MNQTISIEKKLKVKNFIRAPQKMEAIGILLLFILQRINIFGMHPFGCVLFSAALPRSLGYLAIPSIFLGAVFSDASYLKYTVIALIIWMSDVFLYIKGKKSIPGMIVCVFAVFVCSVDEITKGGVYAFSKVLCEMLITGVSYPIFMSFKTAVNKYEKNEANEKEEKVSLMILTLLTLWGLHGINLGFGISLKYIFMIFLILANTMYSNISEIVTFSLLTGFLGVFNIPESLVVGGVMAVGASCGALFRNYKRLAVTVGFLSGISICVLLAGNTQFLPVGLLNIFSACALFNILPLKIIHKTGMFLSSIFKTEQRRRDLRLKEYLKEELSGFANTFNEFGRQFKNTFQKGTQNKETEITEIFDEAADRICCNCKRNGVCWSKEYNDTYRYMFEIMKIREDSGFVNCENAPIVFLEKCLNPELFLNEFNHIYEIKKQDYIRRGMKFEDREMISGQYSEISKIIKELSEEIDGNFFFDEQKEKSILKDCSKEGVYVRDLNVIRNKDGYYEVFFAPGLDEDVDTIIRISQNVLNMKMRKEECKNKSIQKLVADNVYKVSVSIKQSKRDTEPVSGDTALYFETVKNRYYIILCDGMGSGYDAQKESRMTAELLGGFLKAGFSKEAAIALINSTLALKMDREGFSTIDICEIDLRSGETEFVKVGGVQSYIKNNDIIKTVSAKGLPAGIIDDIETEGEKYKLVPGDRIVMLSDGVSEAGYGMMRGEWIKKILNENISDEEMSDKIIKTAQNKIYPRIPDDMTVCTVSIEAVLEENELDEAI